MNDVASAQRLLRSEQVEPFRHDEFVTAQTDHFVEMTRGRLPAVLVDMGGGCGYFARSLGERLSRLKVRVVDADPFSVQLAGEAGVDASVGNALQPVFAGDEEMASFNLILHHLIADNEAQTLAIQRRALSVWRQQATALFVNEYIYESFVSDVSGWLIYRITRSRVLSSIGRAAGKMVPALRANTFGVGVRFRSHGEWECKVFEPAGWRVVRRLRGQDEPVSWLWRVLLIKSIHRDSFLLEPVTSLSNPTTPAS
jgi:hypothetical protein